MSELVDVAFSHVDPSVGRRDHLGADDVVAWFDTPAGPRGVRLAHLTLLRGAGLGGCPVALRGARVEALCAPVREAPLERVPGSADPDEAEPLEVLRLDRRFELCPDQDSPSWTLLGFDDLNRVDVHLLRHVLGLGERDPVAARARWSERLGVEVSEARPLAELQAAGCLAWQRLRPGVEVEEHVRLYAGLSAATRTDCLAALGRLRERYMAAARDGISSVAHQATCRHAHLKTPGRTLMHFVDDGGLKAVAEGPPHALALRTAYLLRAEDEVEFGPASLRIAWRRLRQDLRLHPVDFHVHQPHRWLGSS